MKRIISETQTPHYLNIELLAKQRKLKGASSGEQIHASVDVNSRSTRKLNKKSNQENATVVNYISGNYKRFPVIEEKERNYKQEQKINVFPYDKSCGVARLGKNSNVSILLEKRGL